MPTDTWIVGVDGSECSRRAARWAARHATGRTRHVRIATAWSVPAIASIAPLGPVLMAVDPTEVRNATRSAADSIATEMRSLLTARARGVEGGVGGGVDGGVGGGVDGGSVDVGVAVDVAVEIRQGGAAASLLDLAEHASLLVVGSRGLGGFGRLVLGSTSTQCATHSTSPTVVVPAHESSESDVSRIVVAFDGSANSAAALRWALEFSRHTGSERTLERTIECVMVWDVSPITVGADQFFFPEATELARERFDRLVDDALADSDVTADVSIATVDTVHESRPPAPTVERRFVEGSPRSALVAAAEGADLLVMGARGHGAIGAGILGSVSTSLLHTVRRPIIVVPHPPHIQR